MSSSIAEISPVASSSEEEFDEEAVNQVAVIHRLSVGAICTSGFQALLSKKRKMPLYPKDMVDLFPELSSSLPCQLCKGVSSNCPLCTEAKSIDDSCSEEAEQRMRVSQETGCSTSEAREIILLRPAAVMEESQRKRTQELLETSRTNTHRSTTIRNPVNVIDKEKQSQQRTQQRLKTPPWEDETCGASSTIGPEITTSKSHPRVERSSLESNSGNESSSAMQVTQRELLSLDAELSDNQSNDSFDSSIPEITETVRQRSMMSVPGAVAIPGMNASAYSGTESDDETTISMQEALRRISTMDAEGLFQYGNDAPEITETVRQQSMMSVPGAVAVDGINGRFGSDTDSDNETTNSMREALRHISNYRFSGDILVQGVLANEHADVEAYVAVSVICQAPVVDAGGIHVISVDDDELEEPDSSSYKTIHWGALLVCSVVAAVLICTVCFFTIRNRQGETDRKFLHTESPTLSPTFAPTNSELPNIIKVLKTVTGEEVLWDRTTPQFMAAEWLSTDLAEKHLSNAKMIQRYVLATLQFAFGIDYICDERSCTYYHSSIPFLTEEDECTWDGIECNDDGFVTRILLFNRPADLSLKEVSGWKPSAPRGKDGRLPSEIKALTELSVLVIEGYDIRGSIDHIFDPSLQKLRTIRLSGNSLTGSLSNRIWLTHPDLEVLDVSNNQLSGQIPFGLGRATSLKILNLRNNDFSGPIPPSVGDLKSLELLNLARTRIEGTLPSEIGGFSGSLLTLDVSHTSLGGPLPNELKLFHSLGVLNLEGCSFDGQIPELFCENAEAIRLNGNQFSGTIPSSLGRCTNLKQLNLRNNPYLKGEIPQNLCGNRWDYVQQFTSFDVDCGIVCNCCDFNAQCDDDW